MFDNFIEFISNELFDIWQIACLVESKWISRHHKYISIKTRRIKYLFATIILIYYYRPKQIDGITFDLRMMSICLVSNKTKQINIRKKTNPDIKQKIPKKIERNVKWSHQWRRRRRRRICAPFAIWISILSIITRANATESA